MNLQQAVQQLVDKHGTQAAAARVADVTTLRASWEQAEAEAKARARADAAERDAARLDWLDSQWRDGIHVEVCAINDGLTVHGLRRRATVYVANEKHEATSVRAAIDAAMNKGAQT